MSSFFVVGTEERVSEVLMTSAGLVKVPGGLLLKSGSRPVRAGELMAEDSTTKLGMPRKSTQLSGEHLTGVTDITVDDAHNFEVGETIDVGAQTGKVITAINYTTNVITMDATLGGTVADNARVHNPLTAMNTAVGIALSAMIDRYNTALANRHGVVPFGDLAIRGVFKETAIQDLNSEATTDLTGVSELNGSYIV